MVSNTFYATRRTAGGRAGPHPGCRLDRLRHRSGSRSLPAVPRSDRRGGDLYGHDAGDVVLREAAQSISTSVRAGDAVARIGGDEFAVLLWHVALDEASHVIDRITRRIDLVGEHYPNAHLGVSIGIGYFDTPPVDREDAVRVAGRAMYRSKESRRQTGR